MMMSNRFLSRTVSLGMVIFLSITSVFAQSDNPDPAILEAQDFVADGNEKFVSKEFTAAESSYRKAVAKDPANVSAKYNMGNNYYRNKKYAEGMTRYIQATEVAQTKFEKHQAFHNLGNAFYQQKDYKKAVEAYKNALRNDPTDDETRYNLALAKKEEEKNGGGGGGDDKDNNKDKGDENKDKEGDGDDKEGDDGKPKDSDDQGDKKDKGDENKDEKGKPEDKEGDKPKDGKDGDKPKEQPQSQPGQGQLSPQQVKSLLEAMKNEENKVQDKINAQKVKGAKVKTDKDW